MSVTYSDLLSIPATFAPSAHEASHVTGTDQIPSASASTRGLLAQLSGNVTDYVGGDNACHGFPNNPYVIGDVAAAAAYPAAGIIVPRYKNHPDAIWAYSAFDDHFDTPASGTPNAKWVYAVSAAGLVNPLYGQAGSRLYMSQQGAADTTSRNQQLTQNLPSSNPLTLSAKMSFLGLPFYSIGAGTTSTVAFDIRLMNATGGGVIAGFEADYIQSSAKSTAYIYVYYGAALATAYYLAATITTLYIRMVYAADKSTTVYVSVDGINFMAILSVTGPNSSFSTTVPSLGKFNLATVNAAFGQASVDWVKLTYP